MSRLMATLGKRPSHHFDQTQQVSTARDNAYVRGVWGEYLSDACPTPFTLPFTRLRTVTQTKAADSCKQTRMIPCLLVLLLIVTCTRISFKRGLMDNHIGFIDFFFSRVVNRRVWNSIKCKNYHLRYCIIRKCLLTSNSEVINLESMFF